jgi:hypothetical protein
MLPVRLRFKKELLATVWVFLMIGLLSCGKKTNPIVPVKVLPQKVEHLDYQIKGKSLLVSWDIPQKNTDGSPLRDLKGFKLLKGEWPTQEFCLTCPDRFQETLWIDLKGPELPDITIAPEEVRLTLNRLRPGYTYVFQVIAVTKKDLASEQSRTLRVAWDLPLMPPIDLGAKPVQQGLEVFWDRPKALVDGSPPEGLVGYVLYRRTGKGPWISLNTHDKPIEKTDFIDSDLQEGTTYTYRVKALRRIQEYYLESESSEELTMVYTRVTPPPAVKELVAFVIPKGIEIRWEGIETMALSGYYIYRRTSDEKTAKRITPEPMKDTIFEDSGVVPGTTYFYSVSAVGGQPAFQEGLRSREVKITFDP